MADVKQQTKATETAAFAAVSAPPACEAEAQQTVPELVVTLRRPFMFEGEEYTEIDFSGLARMTAEDALKLDNIIVRRPDFGAGMVPMTQGSYMLTLMHLASGLPVELFQILPIRTMRQLQEAINDYLSARDDSGYLPDLTARLCDGITLNGQLMLDLDLEGLEDLTTCDQDAAELIAVKAAGGRRYKRLGILILHQMYLFTLAAKALRIPVTRLNALSFRDALTVRSVVTVFLGDWD